MNISAGRPKVTHDPGRRLLQRLCRGRISHAPDFRKENDLHRARFTVFFFAGLMGLTLWAMQDFPAGTTH
jgi:hypothetical protein